MSRKVWTTQGKVIVAVIIALLCFGGYKAILKVKKEVNINRLMEPNNEK